MPREAPSSPSPGIQTSGLLVSWCLHWSWAPLRPSETKLLMDGSAKPKQQRQHRHLRSTDRCQHACGSWFLFEVPLCRGTGILGEPALSACDWGSPGPGGASSCPVCSFLSPGLHTHWPLCLDHIVLMLFSSSSLPFHSSHLTAMLDPALTSFHTVPLPPGSLPGLHKALSVSLLRDHRHLYHQPLSSRTL